MTRRHYLCPPYLFTILELLHQALFMTSCLRICDRCINFIGNLLQIRLSLVIQIRKAPLQADFSRNTRLDSRRKKKLNFRSRQIESHFSACLGSLNKGSRVMAMFIFFHVALKRDNIFTKR